MSNNQYYNFYYDPVRQGFDTSEWRKLFGDVLVVGGKLMLTKASILHYGDILRGDAVFNVNIGAPVVGADRKFGFMQYSKNSYAYFKIINSVLTVETSDGGSNTGSTAITWQTAWTNTDTEFRVKWEAGRVEFHIGGIKQTTIADDSVTGTPMSLYIHSNTTDDPFLLKYIDVQAIQSYLIHADYEDSIQEPLVWETDNINITESITAVTTLAGIDVSDDITISENVTVAIV